MSYFIRQYIIQHEIIHSQYYPLRIRNYQARILSAPTKKRCFYSTDVYLVLLLFRRYQVFNCYFNCYLAIDEGYVLSFVAHGSLIPDSNVILVNATEHTECECW